MKILVTGATGYIGSRVASMLAARGDQVVGLVRTAERASALPKGVAPAVANLNDAAAIGRLALKADATLHTGFATHGRDWFAAVDIEAQLIRYLAETMRGKDKRLVVSNGTGFYGDGDGFLDETTPLPPDHPAHARALATAPATSTPGLAGVELRLASFVYGDGASVFMPILVEHARRTGRSLFIGEGLNRLSAVHVEDAAAAFVAALDSDQHGIFHIASDEAPPMRDLAAAIAIGARARAESVSREEAAQALDPFTAMFLGLDNALSSRRARCALCWAPRGQPGLLWDAAFGSYSRV